MIALRGGGCPPGARLEIVPLPPFSKDLQMRQNLFFGVRHEY